MMSSAIKGRRLDSREEATRLLAVLLHSLRHDFPDYLSPRAKAQIAAAVAVAEDTASEWPGKAD
jgi:hypothetical protein